MEKSAKMLLTDSYYGVFSLLTEELKGKTGNIEEKNYIFCEEKISLMAERAVCDNFGGTFNTEIFSFGNYLKSRERVDALSREGSAMVVKRILGETTLETLKAGKADLAPSLFDLIVQLKSASISPENLISAAKELSGERAKKVNDVAKVFFAYEKFLKDNGFTDQSGVLDRLPNAVKSDESIKNARVYLVGFASWTAQARKAIATLLNNAKQVTAILTGGDNGFLYLNETAEHFRNICYSQGFKVFEYFTSFYAEDQALLSKTMFDPVKRQTGQKKLTDKIVRISSASPETEAQFVAESIATGVKNGNRYKDYTVAVPNVSEYGKRLKYYFDMFSVPYFVDEKINPQCHPLVRLITAYYDMFRKNFDQKSVIGFFKNPFFCEDKRLTDFMEIYCGKYNVSYDKFKKPFTLGEAEELKKAEDFRLQLEKFLLRLNVNEMLLRLNVKEKTEEFTKKLKLAGEEVSAEINSQMYEAVMKILSDMDIILADCEVSILERKNVFKSGVSALELSIIPQYGDAVYVGDYRSTAPARAKKLYALGLTSAVPSVKEDVAVFNDDDIKALSENLVIDPTVKIVNRRTKENFGMAMLAFDEKLYACCPDVGGDGKNTVKSELFTYFDRAVTYKTVDVNDEVLSKNRYMSEKQGALSFASDCRDFYEGLLNDDLMNRAAAFYEISDKTLLDGILAGVNKKLSSKIKLEGVTEKLFNTSSPTKIEDFYSCPYKAFASRILRLKDTDDGSITPLVAGNFMHEIFKKYLSDFNKIHDRQSSENVFTAAVDEVLNDYKYKKFFGDKEYEAVFKRIIDECGDYCYKFYLNLTEDDEEKKDTSPHFIPDALEKKIDFTLPETGFRITGTVDRTDILVDGENNALKKDGKKRIRIIDYKSGKVEGDDKLLYVGKKLQLYLYAAALSKAADVAGIYYVNVKNEYNAENKKALAMSVGKTVDDEEILKITSKTSENSLPFAAIQNRGNSNSDKKVTEQTLKACINYAVRLSENAVKQMREGVIVASPYESCGGCKFKGLCGNDDNVRKVAQKVKSEQIASINVEDNL